MWALRRTSRTTAWIRCTSRKGRSFSRGARPVSKDEVFDNRHMLRRCCQEEVTVLREACRTFRRHFLQIGNVEVFLQSMNIASACNKTFRNISSNPTGYELFAPEAVWTEGSGARKRWSGSCRKKRRTRGSCTRRTGRNANCPNCQIYVWMTSARRRARYTSLWGVTATAIHACRLGTRLRHSGKTP